MNVASIDGADLEFEISGGGEPVVFIHGAIIADAFRPLIFRENLASHYQLILYRRRGYGNSTQVSGTISIEQQAADCRNLLEELNAAPAHIVGHSYGGSVALQMALDAPEVVHSLALLEPALLVGTSAGGYRASLEQSIARFREAGAAIAVSEFMQARGMTDQGALDEMIPGSYDQAVKDAPTVFESDIPGLLQWTFGETEARRIGHPALSILGSESDAHWSRFGETHRALLEWSPAVEGYVLPDTAHFPQLENPDDLADALLAFWSRHPIASDG